jgi:hypothetical protein
MKRILICYNIQKCLSVWSLIGSAPGHHRRLRPVSLELEWPEPKIFGKKNCPKVAKLPKIGHLRIIFAVSWHTMIRGIQIIVNN